jgi:outer membrane protein
MAMRTVRVLTFVLPLTLGAHAAAAQAPTPAPVQAPQLFPPEARIAFVDLNQVATTSAAGKELLGRLKTFRDGKLFELTEKQKQLDGLQARLDGGATVLTQAARAQLAKDIDRMKRELQFTSEDAQAQLGGMEQDGFADLRKRIGPILKDIATERHLDAIFNTPESGASYVDPRVDLSAEVSKRLDAATARK